MCFSATASFAAGGSLAAIGAATIKKVERRSELPFATIPLLFGIQQTVEGVVWLTFRYDAPILQHVMTDVYAVFSHVLWPIYVPFAIGFLDSTPWRRKTLFAFQAAGIVVGLYLLYSLVARPVVAQVIGKHIVYVSPHFYLVPVMVLYLAATCVSCFFSSHRFVNLFGILGFGSFAAASWVHASALVSIWCFFYAILSVLIYIHLRYRGLGGFPATPGVAASSERWGT
ncbi:MAG: DUF6629 family protein [Gemmatimonadota bacterium]